MEKKEKSKLSIWLSVLTGLALLSGCGGQLYRVATPPKATAPTLPTATSESVVAAHLLSGDELMEQFEANLLLAGLLVIDVRVADRRNQSQSVTFALSDSAGTSFKPLLPKQALQQVMDFYGNRLYAKAAYQNTLEQYEKLALPFQLDLAAQSEKRGFLFFATKSDATTLRGLQLVTQGAAPATINLN